MIVSIANSFMYGGSRVYASKTGVRVNEWRVMNSIATKPGAVAADIAALLKLNKAVVSRTISTLKELGLIVVEREVGAKRIYLTSAGLEVHQRIVPLARLRMKELTRGFTAADTEQFLGYLSRANANLEGLRAYDQMLIDTVND
ncbi:MarR family winged helix-turn-helix transcriptional regulator [Rhodococcus sp. T2V]|uniref:MarR family winged helix-turn-helix transcriptional regulator n=1 Tax=Rhodococcus sp. T2V TaxID=3034164 RepID=UPI0023E2B78F|nr:MarR family transcriptional regulator [Rhodococcus sp. T2V]